MPQIPIDSGLRDPEHLADLGVGQAAEVAQLDGFCLAVIELPELIDGLIQSQHVDTAGFGSRQPVLQRDAEILAAALLGMVAPRPLDQDPAHDPRRDAQEMGAVLPVDVGVQEAKIGLVHQDGGLD